MVEKSFASCSNAFGESWRDVSYLKINARQGLTSLSWTAGSGHGVKTMPGGNTINDPGRSRIMVGKDGW